MRLETILVALSALVLSLNSCKKANISISVETGDAVDVGFNSAVLTGSVIISGSVSDITFGVHYSLSEGMITSNSTEVIAVSPDKDHSFSVEVEGLKPNTKYYYRTFAKASDVYTFGETKSFTTFKEPTIKLLIDSASFDFMKHDGTFDVAIENPISGCSLSASTNDAWITDVKVNGNTVTYKVAENNSGAGRFGSIKVQYGLAVATYKVTQTSPALSLSPNSAETDYTSKAQSFNYSIENPMAGLSVSATSEETWITGVKVSGNTVNYNVAENNSEVMRAGLIKLTYGPVTKYFSVTQTYSASGITFSPTSQSTDYAAKNLSFTFAISNPRNGATASASTADDWITDVKLNGTTVSYKVTENNSGASRSGKIKLTYGTVSKEFSVTQTYIAPVITFSPTSQSTDYTAKSLSFTFSVDTPRQGVTASASTTDSWITNVQLSGNAVNYKVAENNSGVRRVGKIKLTYGTVSKEFSVTQTYTAPEIIFTPASQSTDYTAKSLSFTYSVDTPRQGATSSASTTEAWITDVQINGSTVSYKVAENNSGASRSGVIKLTYASAVKEFFVMQTYSATSITFTPTSQSTDCAAKSLSFTYAIKNPRDEATAGVSTTDTWITNVQINGNTVSYNVAANYSDASRTGKIVFTYGSTSKEFTVKQSSYQVDVTFTPEGEITDYTAKKLSFTYTINGPLDGTTMSAEVQFDWITNIQIIGNTVYYKVEENNDSKLRHSYICLRCATPEHTLWLKYFIVYQEMRHIPVDLGLSVKWATCNVGASDLQDYGDYFQWAGTTRVTDDSIYLYWNNCPYHTGSDRDTGWTKYVPTSKSSFWSGIGSPDNKTVLDLSDDVARKAWGDSWRMPTKAEWDELRSTKNCSWTWVSINGVYGYEVRSKKTGYTDRWIFLPYAGYRHGSDISKGSGYWSSSLYTNYPYDAYYVYFDSSNVGSSGTLRYYGFPVRPVSE